MKYAKQTDLLRKNKNKYEYDILINKFHECVRQ